MIEHEVDRLVEGCLEPVRVAALYLLGDAAHELWPPRRRVVGPADSAQRDRGECRSIGGEPGEMVGEGPLP